MLKGVPSIISPELLKLLCEMGHGDRLVIADGNFPSASVGSGSHVIRADGHGGVELLDAILQLIPLDASVDTPVLLMEVTPGDDVETPIWKDYEEVIGRHDSRGAGAISAIERYSFYEEARRCYCIVATGESALYANVMLQKGVITE